MTIENLLASTLASLQFRRSEEVCAGLLNTIKALTSEDIDLARSTFKPIEDGSRKILIAPLGDLEETVLQLRAAEVKLGKRFGELLLPKNIKTPDDLIASLFIGIVKTEFGDGSRSEIAFVRDQQALAMLARKRSLVPLMIAAAYGASSATKMQLPICQHIRRHPEGGLMLTTCNFQDVGEMYHDLCLHHCS